MRYGFLTYLNGTFFIRRMGQHTYAFTDAIRPNDKHPTLLEMLLCEPGQRSGDGGAGTAAELYWMASGPQPAAPKRVKGEVFIRFGREPPGHAAWEDSAILCTPHHAVVPATIFEVLTPRHSAHTHLTLETHRRAAEAGGGGPLAQ